MSEPVFQPDEFSLALMTFAVGFFRGVEEHGPSPYEVVQGVITIQTLLLGVILARHRRGSA